MTDKSEIKERLLQETSKTKQIIADYKELTKPVEPDCAVGRVSRMDAINNKSVTEAALRQAESKLKALQHVLSNLNNADFGLCERCKNPIPLERILFMPQSRFCVHCAR